MYQPLGRLRTGMLTALLLLAAPAANGMHVGIIVNRPTKLKLKALFPDHAPSSKVIDPVYFGLMFVLNGAIGLITPPVGTVLNVVAGVGRMRLEQVVRGVNPYLLTYLAILALFVVFPPIVTAPVAWMR